MTRRIGLICVITLAIIVNFSGCTPKSTEREEVVSNGKKIIVLNTAASYDRKESADTNAKEFSVDKIDKYDGIRGEDWIDNDDILISQENVNLKPIQVQDAMENIRNLYIYQPQTTSKKSLYDEKEYLWMPIISPDKKYILVQNYKDGEYVGIILDTDGNVIAENHDEDPAKGFHLSYNNAKWVDNEQVIIPTSDQGICLMDINSNITYISNIGAMQTDTACKMDNKIYYVSTERNLMSYDITTKQNTVVKKGVLNFELSPKKDMFSVVLKEKDDRNILMLIGIDGNEKSKLEEAKMIFGMSWSPDQTKLAYLLTAEKESESGLYIRNLNSQTKLFVSSDFMSVDNGLKWNPSGNKLLASIGEVKDMKYMDNTYIITVNDTQESSMTNIE
jgi:TolB protein